MSDWRCPYCGEQLAPVPTTGMEELQAAMELMGHCRREHPAQYQLAWPPEIRAWYEAGQADQALAQQREWLEAFRMDP